MNQALFKGPSGSVNGQAPATRQDAAQSRIERHAGDPGLELRISLALISALITVGFGYVVFARTAVGLFWDAGFLVSSIAFLVAFISVIWRFADVQIEESKHAGDEDSWSPQ
jgi:hypothetical protein